MNLRITKVHTQLYMMLIVIEKHLEHVKQISCCSNGLTADVKACLHLNEHHHSMSVQQLQLIFEIITTVSEALKPDHTCYKLFTALQFGEFLKFV